MSTFHERKAERTAHYAKYVFGWKQKKCVACNGSGYYDSHGSPPCGACDGTGKEWAPPKPKDLAVPVGVKKDGGPKVC